MMIVVTTVCLFSEDKTRDRRLTKDDRLSEKTTQQHLEENPLNSRCPPKSKPKANENRKHGPKVDLYAYAQATKRSKGEGTTGLWLRRKNDTPPNPNNSILKGSSGRAAEMNAATPPQSPLPDGPHSVIET
jgi:hypothetical protein